LTGLFAGAAVAGVIGIVSGAIILRTTGLTLLMQTLVIATMLLEAANKASSISGGADGLQGMDVWSIFGVFRFDLFGRTAYLYCLVVLLACWFAVRCIVHSSFGLALNGIRENVGRMHAVGSPVERRKLIVYTISAALAGMAGAVIAQDTQFLGLGVARPGRLGAVLVLLVLGRVGAVAGLLVGVLLSM